MQVIVIITTFLNYFSCFMNAKSKIKANLYIYFFLALDTV